jgi:hypothetical protein
MPFNAYEGIRVPPASGNPRALGRRPSLDETTTSWNERPAAAAAKVSAMSEFFNSHSAGITPLAGRHTSEFYTVTKTI